MRTRAELAAIVRRTLGALPPSRSATRSRSSRRSRSLTSSSAWPPLAAEQERSSTTAASCTPEHPGQRSPARSRGASIASRELGVAATSRDSATGHRPPPTGATGSRYLRRCAHPPASSPSPITARKISPTISMPMMTSRPSVAASASSASIERESNRRGRRAAASARSTALVAGGVAREREQRRRVAAQRSASRPPSSRPCRAAPRSPPRRRRRRRAPSARSCAQSEISAARSATASTLVERRDADEPVRVEVVAEQERRVVVRRREQARPAVVER